MSTMFAARGKLNALQRHRAPDDPAIAAAKVDLRVAKLADEIIREAEADPPLTVEQRAKLAALLTTPHQGGGRDAAA
jgi:hypothetical protein